MSDITNKIKKIYEEIKDSTDQNFVKSKSLQLKNALQETDGSELNERELFQIKILLGKFIQETVDNGLLNPHEIQQAKQNLTESSQKQAGFSSKLSLGLASILLMCSSLYADISKDYKQSKETMQQESLQWNEFSYSATLSLIKHFQGSVIGNLVDKDGNITHKGVHILYDDCGGRRWDGKQPIQKFIKTCKGKATIGYGETRHSVCKRGFLSQEDADKILFQRVREMLKDNVQIVGKNYFFSLTTKQQACLITLWYNLPGGARETPKLNKYLKYAYNPNLDKSRNPKIKKTLLTRQQYLEKAAKEFLDCNKIDGEQSKGLTNRVTKLSKMFKEQIK